jgi:hypothetical protein
MIKYDSWEYDFKKNKQIKFGVLDLNKYGKHGYTILLIPKKTISVKDIDKAINVWYNNLVKWKYRHWTKSGDQPVFTVDIKIEEEIT